jgi:hypothetical protein
MEMKIKQSSIAEKAENIIKVHYQEKKTVATKDEIRISLSNESMKRGKGVNDKDSFCFVCSLCWSLSILNDKVMLPFYSSFLQIFLFCILVI